MRKFGAPKFRSCRTEISRFESIVITIIKTRQREDGRLAYLSLVLLETSNTQPRGTESDGSSTDWNKVHEFQTTNSIMHTKCLQRFDDKFARNTYAFSER